jgi:hypothetical protein
MVPPAGRFGWRWRAEYVRVPDGLAFDPHDGPDALQLEAILEDGETRWTRPETARIEVGNAPDQPGLRDANGMRGHANPLLMRT